MASASRVAEIFQQASVAFGRLAQLTLDLKLAQAQQNEQGQKTNTKWSDQEVDQLKEAVTRFGNDLGKIAEIIETKTVDQIKLKMKSKVFQDAGVEDTAAVALNTSEEKASLPQSPPCKPLIRNHPDDQETTGNDGAPHAKRGRLNGDAESVDVVAPVKSDEPTKVEEISQPDLMSSLKQGTIFVRNQNRSTYPNLKVPLSIQSSGATGSTHLLSLPHRSESSNVQSAPSDSRYEEYEDSSDAADEGDIYDSEGLSDGDEEDVGDEAEEEEEGAEADAH
ncbi:hypothetical protein AHF37_07588 [Paragonimus kellicotti]|nr:hypothetical protein AHF37_07588 [Paragonimus kellicotti]